MIRRAIAHLRLYESVQILFPGAFGILIQQTFPDLRVLLLYGVTYASHVLSVYSYNDYCDHEIDSANPRKIRHDSKSDRWLRNQTLVLTGIFIAGAAFLPIGVSLLLAVNQITCMAYSDPSIRLKGRLLGSELAHFVAGYSYFTTGVLVAGGSPRDHLLGGILFGLLYLTGGTFNEIMDCHADREADLRHLVVLAGRRRVLRAVLVIHYCGFVLLAMYEPTLLMGVCCGIAVLLYATVSRRLVHDVDNSPRLLRFRRNYRLIFATLLVILSVSRVIDATGESMVLAGNSEVVRVAPSSD